MQTPSRRDRRTLTVPVYRPCRHQAGADVLDSISPNNILTLAVAVSIVTAVGVDAVLRGTGVETMLTTS